jgi:hypothetical protein
MDELHTYTGNVASDNFSHTRYPSSPDQIALRYDGDPQFCLWDSSESSRESCDLMQGQKTLWRGETKSFDC